jgi:hypothetical protein
MEFFKGFAGLFLYIGSLFAPVGESQLNVKNMTLDDEQNYKIATVFEFNWSDDLTDIVNAGIPVVVKYSCRFDRKKYEFYRILRKPISNKNYFVVDSLSSGDTVSKSFPNIPLALKHFRQVEWIIENSASAADFSVEIENSFVPSMKVYADISPAFGGRKFSGKIKIEKELQ